MILTMFKPMFKLWQLPLVFTLAIVLPLLPPFQRPCPDRAADCRKSVSCYCIIRNAGYKWCDTRTG